jgi:hypothetical protein
MAGDLAADVAGQPADPGAQQRQLPTITVELLGVSVAARHHGGVLGDAQVGLPQPHPVRLGKPAQSPDGRMQKLGVGREGDGLGLHRGIDRDPLKVLAPQRPARMRHPQALGQQQLQPVAEPFPPMAQVRAFMRELMLEKLLAGEELEIGVIDPALAHGFVGQSVNVLEQ